MVGFVPGVRGIGIFVAEQTDSRVRPKSLGFDISAQLSSFVDAGKLMEVELAGLTGSKLKAAPHYQASMIQ
jgi:hypothetical protein